MMLQHEEDENKGGKKQMSHFARAMLFVMFAIIIGTTMLSLENKTGGMIKGAVLEKTAQAAGNEVTGIKEVTGAVTGMEEMTAAGQAGEEGMEGVKDG